MPVSAHTAMQIACAYREIETAEKLLSDIADVATPREAPDIRDAFGRRARGLELGVPSGETSRRLFDVPWTLAKPIIEAHIAHQRAIVRALSETARVEASEPS